MRNSGIYAAMALGLLLTCSACLALSRVTDSMALIAIKIANPASRIGSTWNTNLPMDKWFGVGLKNDRVDSLNFTNFALKTLPQEIIYLSELTYLNLISTTQAVDTLPPCCSKACNLYRRNSGTLQT